MELADMTYFAVKTVPLMIYSIPSWVMERISSSAGIRCSIRRAVMFCMWLCWVHVRRWCLPIWVLRVFEIRLCSFGCVFKCKVLPEFLPGYLQTAAYMDNPPPPHPTPAHPTPRSTCIPVFTVLDNNRKERGNCGPTSCTYRQHSAQWNRKSLATVRGGCHSVWRKDQMLFPFYKQFSTTLFIVTSFPKE